MQIQDKMVSVSKNVQKTKKTLQNSKEKKSKSSNQVDMRRFNSDYNKWGDQLRWNI